MLNGSSKLWAHPNVSWVNPNAATLAYVSFSVLTNQLKNVIVVTVRILRQLVAVKEFRLLDWRLPGVFTHCKIPISSLALQQSSSLFDGALDVTGRSQLSVPTCK